VTVAAVDELVGASGEAALGCVLSGREPGEEAWDVEVSRSRRVSVPFKSVCFEGLIVILMRASIQMQRSISIRAIKYTYFGIMT
jgi:hypothetical protein